MAKNKKDKKKQLSPEKRRLLHEKEQLRDLRRKAPHIKALMKLRGIEPAFCDYLDSYEEEFHRVAEVALVEHASLLGIHEFDDEIYRAPEKHFSDFGCDGLTQIFFNIDDQYTDYGSGTAESNMAGVTFAFDNADGDLRTLILIKRDISTTVQHEDLKYAVKIGALYHEIGHVDDWERGINFRGRPEKMDIIESEVYANLFAFEMLAKRNMKQSYDMLADAMEVAATRDNYLAMVARSVIARLPKHQLAEWQDVLKVPMTATERRRMGPSAVRILST